MADRQVLTVPEAFNDLREAASRATESATFSRSARLREFLAFVVRCSVEGRSHEVNEYSIGVQVFGKHPDYNPNQDNIVRVTARQLRAKLSEYYLTEGALDPWRIEIPKGAYQAALVSNTPSEPVKEAAPSAVPATASRNHTSLRAIVSALGLAGWALAAWLHFGVTPRDPVRPGYLLAPILGDRDLPTTIVLDDPVFGRAWWKIGHELGLSGFSSGQYLDSKYYSSDRDRSLLDMLQKNQYLDFPSLQMTQRLSDIARSNGVEAVAISCRTLKPEQLRRGNFIIVGGVSSDPWVGEVQKSLAFEHVTDPSSGSRLYLNRAPKPGEPAAFQTPATNLNPDEHYYTRVALLKNPYGSGRIALLGGTSRETSEAAAQFALSQTGVDQVNQLCGVPPERLAGFELILETKSVAGAHLTQHVVASRCTGNK